MAQYPEKETLFKSAIRQQILSRSQLIKQELAKGTRFVYSEAYPTQVLNTKLGRFIRINQSDIHEDSISNVLKTLMGIDHYFKVPAYEDTLPDGSVVTIPEEEDNIIEILEKAKEKVKFTDFTDLNTFDPDLVIEDYDPSEVHADPYSSQTEDVFTYDKFGNITGSTFNIQPQIIHTKLSDMDPEEIDYSKLDYDEDVEDIKGKDSSSTDMTSYAESLSDKLNSEDSSPSNETSQNVLLEQALEDLPQYKNVSRFHSEKSILTKKDLEKLQPKVKQLLKAFQGKGDQVKLVTPTKRMSSKDIATDRDKCYIRKTGTKGKHIKLNFLIDMSGSMGGNPVKNAVRLVYLFNQLAKEGYVTMSVLYSTTNTNYRLTLPATDAEILSLNRVQNAEGLAKTIHAHSDVIRGVNTICITDGDIVDEAIDKNFWAKHRSVSTGIYVNKNITSYTEYTGKLNKWFNHSIVRKTLDELIEWLIRTGLKG